MQPNQWRQSLKAYAQADRRKAWIQISNTLLPYILLLGLMAFGVFKRGAFLWLLLLAIPAGALMVRIFIFFHDCTHLSFFETKGGNEIAGYFFGVLTFTPYAIWQSEHNKHHGTVGNLDERGVGDIWTMTVEEYVQSSRWRKLQYRIFRHPIFLFFIAPFLLFALRHRLPSRRFNTWKHQKSYLLTNLGVFAIAGAIGGLFGIRYYLWIQLPVLYFASVMGVWLFFVQHQFEEVYWERHSEWDLMKAAWDGSSFYQLPTVLEWFSGYIGYHHIHHLNPRIPNYHLKQCYKEIQGHEHERTIRFLESFKLAVLHLYDEKRGKLIRIRDLKRSEYKSC